VIAYNIKGAARLAATLDAAARKLGDLGEAAGAAGRIISDASAATAPHRTGALAGSVGPEVSGSDVVVGTDIVYGPPIHNGWLAHGIAPNPFLERGTQRT
jgi:hypothetical protein